jgi:hypothetical protein
LLSDVLKRPQSEVRHYVGSVLGSDLDTQMKLLAADFMDRSFSSMPIHGDPHPGNVMLLTNNKVALIDFGLIAQPGDDTLGYLDYMREQSFINNGEIRPGKFGITLLRTHSAGLYRALDTIDGSLPQTELLSSLESMMRGRFYKNADNVDAVVFEMQGGRTNQIYDSVMNPDNSLALSFDMDGMLMLRANNIIWTSMIQLGIYRDIVPEIVDNAVTRASSRSVLSRQKIKSQDLEDALEYVGQWLLMMRESDPLMYWSIKRLLPQQLWQQ